VLWIGEATELLLLNHQNIEQKIFDFDTMEKPSSPSELIAFGVIDIPERLRVCEIPNDNLSVRLINVFRNRDLKLLGDLHGLRFKEFMSYRNFGKKTLLELNAFLMRFEARITRKALSHKSF